MATIATTASKPGKQLGELLQEQQEPFVLEVYLTERGCVGKKKNTTSGANFIGFHGNLDKFLNKSKWGTQNKSKKGSIPHFPTVLKFACNKLLTIKGLRTKNSDGKPGVIEMVRHNQETAEADRFSSASSTRAYNSSSDSDIDEPSSMFADNSESNLKLCDERERKAVVDAKFQWSCMGRSPQLVTEEISTSTGSSLDNNRKVSRKRQKSFFLPRLITGDSILSASLWNILVQTTPDKSSFAGLTELRGPDSDWSNSSQLSISKRVLQQTKQLLLDCVREFVDNDHEKEVVGYEEIGKAIGEKIKEWGKRCGEESNMEQPPLESNIMDSTQEWNSFESQKRDIVSAIAEEITNDVVMDIMMNFLCYS